jgi:hypothetical protein
MLMLPRVEFSSGRGDRIELPAAGRHTLPWSMGAIARASGHSIMDGEEVTRNTTDIEDAGFAF